MPLYLNIEPNSQFHGALYARYMNCILSILLCESRKQTNTPQCYLPLKKSNSAVLICVGTGNILGYISNTDYCLNFCY